MSIILSLLIGKRLTLGMIEKWDWSYHGRERARIPSLLN